MKFGDSLTQKVIDIFYILKKEIIYSLNMFIAICIDNLHINVTDLKL